MLKPVYIDNNVQLYDIFTASGQWLGSRRTFVAAYKVLYERSS